MKNLIVITGLIVLSLTSCKKDKPVKCVEQIIIQPGSDFGKDAIIWTEMPDQPFPDLNELSCVGWTWHAQGFDAGVVRGLIQFDLSVIPATAKIHSAKLSL